MRASSSDCSRRVSRCRAVQVVQQSQLRPLARFVHALGRRQIPDRLLVREDRRALIGRGHESRSPIARSVDDFARIVFQHHERGQVLVLGAQSVGDPRPQRRTAAQDGPGIHLADAVGVIQAVGPAGTNHGDVVDALGRVRQPVADPGAGLTVLFPSAFAGHQRRAVLAHRRNDRAKTFRQRLTRQLVQQRLGIEQIDVAGTAFHEQENDALGSRRMMGRRGGTCGQ